MNKDEALKLALEVLEELNNTNSYWWQEVDETTAAKIDPAITAIKQALALDKKAENARELGLDYEPVFCEYCGGNDDADFGLPTDHCTDCARPQPAAQRQWAGLTDEEEDAAFEQSMEVRPKDASNKETRRLYAKAIEAKLKEKNT